MAGTVEIYWPGWAAEYDSDLRKASDRHRDGGDNLPFARPFRNGYVAQDSAELSVWCPKCSTPN